MKWLKPGSFLWLIAHELRLSFRGSVRANRAGLIITAAFIVVLTIFAGIPLAVALHHFDVMLTPIVILILDLTLAVLLTLLLSQTLSSATLALYERGDLDLLLSSPLSSRRVLSVRALVIALSPLTIYLSLLGPLVVPLALFGHAAWLASVGVLVSLALVASALGLALAMALFGLIGPRRTRTVGQLLAAFIGAALFLAGQSRYLFAGRTANAFTIIKHLASNGPFRRDSVFVLPAEAVVGTPIPFIALCAGSIVVFVLTTFALGARFSKDASVAAGNHSGRRRTGATARTRGFRGGVFQGLVRKELILLARDPALLSQVFLRVLYLLPLVFLLLSNARAHLMGQAASGTAALVFIASQIAASLAWITISAEDAPDLLLSAPIGGAFVRRAKLCAALLPLGVLLAVPIAVLAWLSPWMGIVAAVFVVVSSLSAGLINLWYEAPGRRNLFRRRGSGTLVANIAVLLIGLAWSATAFSAALGSIWSVFGALATLAVLAGFRRGRTTALA